ncbi:hypothetical protein ACFFX1_09715 [Dactylosporangium sucinum]|uniref:Exo-alpha-sialidase n=1 Tax=Dactylosporangium sucinum TaxID=1424081 RepID=A0A917TKM8_9ACTN|nr:sialidase family protein [Dactylosporangium sucinum]GGM25549.1 hypothetical protein GCM10007977_028410 [Dactylosporangium sucinum]
MTDLSELLEDLAQAPAPPSRLRPRDLYTRGRRRHRRLTAATLTAAGAAMIMLTAGVVFATLDGGAGPRPPEPPAEQPVQWRTGSVFAAAASDAGHLYAVVLDCPDSLTEPAWLDCNQDLVRSDDAGRTWQVRSRGLGSFESTDLTPLTDDILVVRAQKVASPGILPQSGVYVSIDGGRTWKAVERQSTPTPSVPADGWLEPSYLQAGVGVDVGVGDPRLGRSAPLANPPALAYRSSLRTATGGLWISGEDPATRLPAVAVSDDAGRTWSTRVLTDVAAPGDSSYSTRLASLDGRTGYAVSMTGMGLDGGGRAWVHRTTDGGHSWQRVDPGGTAPWSYGGGSSFVTPDGAHVIADLGRDGKVTFRISRDGGAHYTPVTLDGLPAEGIYGAGTPVQALPGGGYLAYAPGDAVYVSTDGLHWRRIVPDVP